MLLIAGFTRLLHYKHHQLWIHGSSRLPDVWRISQVSNDFKSSYKKNKHTDSNLHHLISPLTKYAVIITPITTAIEEAFPRFRNSRSLNIIMRKAIVISTLIVALTNLFFGNVMVFTGAFLCVTGSFLLPCLCYLHINKAAQRFGLELMMIVGILMVGSLWVW